MKGIFILMLVSLFMSLCILVNSIMSNEIEATLFSMGLTVVSTIGGIIAATELDNRRNNH
jgi:hypothetical protein